MTWKGDNCNLPEMPVEINVNNQITVVFPFKMTMNVIVLKFIHYVLTLATFVKQFLFRIPSLPFNKSDSLAAQADARKLKKLPLHLGMIILEDDMSYTDIANFILWSAAMGISFISIYDTNGIVKRNEKTLREEIARRKSSYNDSENSKADIEVHSSLEKLTNKSSSQVDVFLLSVKDGRQSIVNMARHICHQVSLRQLKSVELSPHSVDKLFQEETGYPDPDLVVKFGSAETLMGFMPWHARLTEILSWPSHFGLEYKTFKSLLVSYGSTEQRFGK
ncbi:dehydrodolichyl diphosphate synthase complex subunit nus1-like [Mercenaria mercenaria]|uniref:dehydrodolichyl diphosphate synthase complex subunit nus1-like n=1 Tax=Mercenaria mercenaria TaxID=6596 RepID=UPI001E1D89E7|nr:dehydrodolichyl diphosphate synthase complex subunit nus1-like [Mercenaria mercenaria]